VVEYLIRFDLAYLLLYSETERQNLFHRRIRGDYKIVANPNIVIETIKRAEDGNGIIVRLYESQRRRGPITLTIGFPVREVWQTNLLEVNEMALTAVGREVRVGVRPFEIVTVRVVL